jgi:endonuclease/exonuclease/phosphatase family metal-dependent hydrolase
MKWVIIALLWAQFGHAENLKIMNFNTNCSICDLKQTEGPFSERIKNLADTVRRHNPDLVSFQEFTFERHVHAVDKMLQDRYIAVFGKGGIYPDTDSTFFVRKDRFQILQYNGAWLGPKAPKFSFGWKMGAPRRFQSVVLLDKTTNRKFIFAGTHFDNSIVNKTPSAVYLHAFFEQQTLPVIFAGDTNLGADSAGYAVLVGQVMRNTFDEVPFTTIANAEFAQTDLCPNENPWPACRIDHVLLSKNAPWKVKSWSEDLYRYYKNEKFTSDHRAVIVELD